jgi:hypothetical protein
VARLPEIDAQARLTFHAAICPFPLPSLFVSFFTFSLTSSRSLGSVGFPLEDTIMTKMRVYWRTMVVC